MRRDLLFFGAAALVQLAVPGWMILQHERVLQRGEVFRFRTAPVDPRDPFRGEYVMLNFDAETGPWKDPAVEGDLGNETTFALLETDTAGSAVITQLLTDRPQQGSYLMVEKGYLLDDTLVQMVSLPFDRFYLEEGDGAKTEDMLAPQWDGETLSQPLPAYALVRVYDGQAVIEDLIVGDRSIHDWLKDMPSKEP